MAKIVGFAGLSNSGKTTLIEKLVRLIVARGQNVFVLKHDPKNKAKPDKEGKDSYRFFESGADVGLLSPQRATLFLQQSVKINQLIEVFKDKDYIFIEGLKTLSFPKIVVVRDVLEESYLQKANVLAIKNIQGLQGLSLDCPQEVLDWIDQNIKEEK